MPGQQCAGRHGLQGHSGCASRKHGHGPTSFWMHDPDRVFAELDLKPGQVFLDAGFGLGEYALHAAGLIGPQGQVHALDKREDLVAGLLARAAEAGLDNLVVQACDLCKRLPLADGSVDCALLSTVLHIFDLNTQAGPLSREIHRVLKPDGFFAVIECKKEETGFGPPMHMRISQEELENAVSPCGFVKAGEVDLGYNYMVRFRAL